MSARHLYTLWAAITVALAGATGYFVSERLSHDHAGHDPDLHDWMHDQLDLSEKQHLDLAPIEEAFDKEKVLLEARIGEASKQLAEAIRGGNPERVDQALTRFNAAQSDLQEKTIGHFFAMREHLDSEQAEKLLQWTHDSIIRR